ncbi:kinase [Dysgonomonas sp. Marseille-P4677]|uniref:kinase n=1 Tax=Dysgonomonas sp. Marseille-P4677 TaxID=2364790 RepID=UPI001911C852|nr:kinase [Dysgonomonas sp. Marseille-P4677]MBK5719763.1 kinase [Dysgonomonas sp. Marseille-P4677]
METYNGIVCISRSTLIISESNPNGIMPEGTLNSLNYRKKLKIVRNGGGEGNPTLIAFDSLPPKYKKLAQERFGDPKVEAEKEGLLKNIEIKSEAVSFFKLHTIEYTDRIENLPEETQELYVNNAAVLDALKLAWDKHVMASRSKSKRPLTGEFWKNAALATQKLLTLKDDKITHDLPKNPRRLQEKLQEYIRDGYISLVSQRFANTYSVKITEKAGKWLVSRWSTRSIDIVTLEQLFAEYNCEAEKRGWKKLKSTKAVRDYLYRPEIEPLWHAARFGELSAKEKFGRQHRRKQLTRRDTLWYSDGTKLNYYYQDENGKTKTCNVYEVMDAYSEVFLGYHISPTEDYEAQYFAYKMAIQRAGHKPYELKYDNQGGHKKLESSDLLKNLARHAVNTAPYNGKSKTIESAFNRFQSQFLHKDWYFTGQNITAKKKESRGNDEFTLENIKRGNLPTLDEVKAQYAKRREEWNNAPHPKTGIARNEMYRTSVNEETQAVDWLDMISIFGVTTKDPATYRAGGLQIEVKKVKYAYEVLTSEGMPDMDFYRKNIGRKFYTRYCPDDMSIVSLYEKDASGMRFVTMAQPFIHIEGAMQNQTSADLSFIRKIDFQNKQMRIDNERERNELLAENNMHPNQHGLSVAPLKGVNTSKAKKGKIDIGELQKEVSNMTALEEQKKTAQRAIKKASKKIEKESSLEQEDFYKARRELLQTSIN